VRGGVLIRLITGWLLLCCAWVFANPPLAAPDEGDHYVRAIGIAQGQLVGAPAPGVRIGADPAEIAYDRSTQRAILVPARLDPRPYNCYLANPRLSAACMNRRPRNGPPSRYVTTVGDYPPLGLLAPAAVVTSAHTPAAAVRLGRLADLVIDLTLLVLAAAAMFDRAAGWLSLIGILAACTPTALFLASSLTPSGMSVCAAIAFVAALLRMSRQQAAPTLVWLLAGLAGATLINSHPTGIVWAALLLGGFALWQRPVRVRALVLAQPRAAVAAGTLLGVGTVAILLWQALYGPRTAIAYRGIRYALAEVPGQYWGALRQLVAGFGYLEFMLPLAFYLLWFGFVVLIAVSAGRHSNSRGRSALVIAAVCVFIVPVGVWMVFGRAAGIGINGREYMPLLVAFPLLAGEILLSRRLSLSGATTRWLAALAALSGVLQFVAWYLNGQRAAVGVSGQLLFAGSAAWRPPLGWLTWMVIAGVGALSLASVPLSTVLSGSRRRHTRPATAQV
jgi:hypothetical protein